MSGLDREGSPSLTSQIVDRLRAGIDDGRLAPGTRLPTTRRLAELAGVNPLTATRAYRRLAELGYVTATVGRGTFVRTLPPASPEAGGTDWQRAILPELPGSYASEILAQTLRLPADPGMLSLATGWPSPALYPTDELARLTAEVFAEDGGRALSYLEPAGLPALRVELARRGARAGFAEDPEEIIVTSGARQAIDLACRAIVAPGDVVACESPTFAGVLGSLQARGARVIAIPVDEHGLDVDALERVLARHEIKACVLQPACQNPTGADLDPERARRLLALARERSFFVLEDAVYATVRYEGGEARRLRERAPERVIYVDSLSKTVGGGLRLGWIASSGPVRARLAALKLTDDVHTSSLVQHLAARYLAHGAHDALLARTVPVYRERRDALLESLRRRLADELTPLTPRGGHHLWATFHHSIDERLLFSEALRHGVAFTPGGSVTADPPDRTSLRLSFSLLEPDELDEAVRRLGVAIRSARRTQRAGLGLALS